MRTIIRKENSTKAERRFAEQLKNLHIPFQHRVRTNNKEIDFVIGNYSVEIDGHKQDPQRNIELFELGYIPIHFENKETESMKLWLERLTNNKL